MKIGILTFQRAHNYGTILQCYALQEVLISLGHEVCIIDYRQEFIDAWYESHFRIRTFIKKLLLNPKQSISYVQDNYRKYKRGKRFKEFRDKYLYMTGSCYKHSFPENLDAIVIGSDQMWGVHITKGLDPVFFGDFNRRHNTSLYGYAISSNGDFLDEIPHDKLLRYLSLFKDFTLREQTVRDRLVKEFGIKKNVNIDPTLLTDERNWSSMVNSKWEGKEYVAIYQVRKLSEKEDRIKSKAEKFAIENNLGIIDMSDMSYSVEDFISIIKYAKIVFTSSFHATVFSLFFSTPLCTFQLYDGHDSRYVDLLHSLGMEYLLVDSNSVIDSIPVMDKEKIIEGLKKIRVDSIKYLSSIS